MSSEVFVNARSLITGADTHASDFTGDLVKTVGTTVGNTGGQIGDISNGGTATVLQGTITVTVTEAINLVILRFSIRATNQSDIELLEGANVLASVNGTSTGTRTINLVLEDVSIGIHAYTCFTVADAGGFYQYWPEGRVLYGAPVNLDDTHAATLSGENTQINHESGVLP